MIVGFKKFVSSKLDEMIKEIKIELLKDASILYYENQLIEEYSDDVELAWVDLVDSQELGQCQSVVSSIQLLAKERKWSNIKPRFGEIEIEYPYIDENGDEQNYMTHHWITIDGVIYEFSKGSLKNYIDWTDLYSIESEGAKKYN